MKRQRGYATLLVYLLIAGAVLGAIYGVYSWIDHTWETTAGIEKGEANKQAAWDKANRDAKEKAEAERRKWIALAEAEYNKRLDAERRADESERKWRNERAKANHGKLADAGCSKPQNNESPRSLVEAPAATGDSGVRFTWRFVGLWDSAWTGRDGKPLYGDPASRTPAGADPDARSPYGPAEAIDNHAENAKRHSQCFRDLNSLMDTIERLQGKPPKPL